MAKDKLSAAKRIDELEHELAVMRSQLSSSERAVKKWYERNRLLEGRVRAAIQVGEHVDTDKLYRLRQSVPTVPRKTWRQLRERFYKRERERRERARRAA